MTTSLHMTASLYRITTDRPNIDGMQAGFSLTELLVAMALAVFMVGGLIQGVVSSKSTFNSINAQSEVQQNGRAALFFLEKEILKAGYVNQLNLASRFDPTKLKEVWPVRPSFSEEGAFIYDGNDIAFNNQKPNTEALVVRYKVIDASAGNLGACGALDISALGSNIADTSDDIKEIVVGFYVSEDNGLRCQYQAHTESNGAYPVVNRLLISGIEEFEVRYGVIDSSQTPPRVSKYLTADNIGIAGGDQWSDVASISFSLLAGSDSSLGTETINLGADITYRLQGVDVSIPDDGKIRRVFSTTQGLRNRL